jgi:hypothetical protein
MESKRKRSLFSSRYLLKISFIFCIFVPYVIIRFLCFYVSFGALKWLISNSLSFFSKVSFSSQEVATSLRNFSPETIFMKVTTVKNGDRLYWNSNYVN